MKTVITYGTFDLFHKGHYNILKRAKEQGDYLIVGVTGESYDLERGKLSVQDSLATRIDNVKKTGFADKIIVEEYLGQKIPDILKYNVDVLVIGSDWKGKFDHLNKYCQVLYLERTKDISSTMIREENMTIYKFGIVTDDIYDNDAVIEPKVVSGIHVESVFAEDAELADSFCERYELFAGFSDYNKFLDSVDIVYIKTRMGNREEYVRRALLAGKHVICDTPYTMDKAASAQLRALAKEQNVILMDNVATIYQHAFGQLMWMTRGNLIGDIVSIDCSLSKESFDDNAAYSFQDLAAYPTCIITKILGTDYEHFNTKLVRNEEGEILYGLITFTYKSAVATAHIGMNMDIDCGMTVYGTNGVINIPEDWWRVGYFKMKALGEERSKHFSSNFEGNGFRYTIQNLLREIRTSHQDAMGITDRENEVILDVLSAIE